MARHNIQNPLSMLAGFDHISILKNYAVVAAAASVYI